MRRRDALAALPALLAGCGAVLHPGPFERRRVELLEYDPLPAEVPFSLTLSEGTTRATPDQRVRFGVELTNESDDVWKLEYYETPLDRLYTATVNDAGYFTAPGDWGPPGAEARKPDCWTPKRDFGGPASSQTHRFAPDDSHRAEITLWDESGGDDCWPTGEHRLAGELHLSGYRCPSEILATVEDDRPIPTAECTEEDFDFEWGVDFAIRELD
jgi:hypothetical protein